MLITLSPKFRSSKFGFVKGNIVQRKSLCSLKTLFTKHPIDASFDDDKGLKGVVPLIFHMFTTEMVRDSVFGRKSVS